MPARDDRIGNKYGRMTVISRISVSEPRWLVRCECGQLGEKTYVTLMNGSGFKHCRCKRDEHFWAQVDKTDTCWLWTGYRMANGYATTANGSGKELVHRVAWDVYTGSPAPKDMLVCHTCDTRHCVRQDHLFLGTPKDNTQDMLSKGRGRWQDARPGCYSREKCRT